MGKQHRSLRRTTPQPWLFAAKSRLGFVVRTTRGYWSLITTVKHPHLAGKEAAVIRTLIEPDEVRRSRVDASVYLFYRKTQRKHLCVVAKRSGPASGFIMTAYVTDKIKEGQLVWKR